MLRSRNVKVLVATAPADMRYSFNGLCGLVRHRLSDDPGTGTLFVFFNKRGDQVRIIYHDVNGFALWSKRLHRGTFERRGSTGAAWEIDLPTLYAILDGEIPARTNAALEKEILSYVLESQAQLR
jgi:transposase